MFAKRQFWPAISLGCLLLVTACAMAAEPAPRENRLWVSGDGQYLRARFAGIQRDEVILEDSRGRQFGILLESLSNEDQRYVAKLLSNDPERAGFAAEAQTEEQKNADLPPAEPRPYRLETPSPKSGSDDSEQPVEVPKALRTLTRLLRSNAEMQKADGEGPLFGSDSSVYIAFSGKFLNEFIQVPIDHQRDVQETILGTPVAGTANTRGTATLRLRPHPDHASFEVLVKGTADSLTSGQQIIVNIESDGSTQFEARKRVDISSSGIDLFEASADANTTIRQAVVSTPIPGRIGSLVGRIAGRVVEANRDRIDYEASERAAYRAAKDLDDRIDSEVVRVQQVLSEIAPGWAAGKPEIPIQFRTSTDRVAILVGEYEPDAWKDFEAHALKDGEDIAVVLPKKTVSTAKQLQMAMKLLSISLEDQLVDLRPEELKPKSQTWSDDQEWLTLVWDVDGTIVELLSKDFQMSTSAAQPTRPPRKPAARETINPLVPRWNQINPAPGR